TWWATLRFEPTLQKTPDTFTTNIMNDQKNNDTTLRSLGLFDVICIIVGIIIGSAIYKTPTSIAGLLGSGEWILFVWILGGVLSFIGALCYAELASAYPKEGGDYYFLHHTYGSWAGFLFAWGRLLVVHSGNIAMMAYIAGEYGERIYYFPHAKTVYSILVIIGFTGINCLGLSTGKRTQNILASAQVIGLLAIIIIAFML
ncbi:MAG: amino acid permease, partial [Planctomycetes bacterium]|nr:amino acid permease [Planctomycetota bacterium]